MLQAPVPPAPGLLSVSQTTATEPSSSASPVNRLMTVIWPVAPPVGLQALTNAWLPVTVVSFCGAVTMVRRLESRVRPVGPVSGPATSICVTRDWSVRPAVAPPARS